MKFTYPCPVCGIQVASLWRILSLGPMSSFQCPHCQTRLGISRGLATVAVVLASLAFPIGAVIAVSMIGSFKGLGMLPLIFVTGGIIACMPVALWLLLSVKLVVREGKGNSYRLWL
jgi:hypothetical protein